MERQKQLNALLAEVEQLQGRHEMIYSSLLRLSKDLGKVRETLSSLIEAKPAQSKVSEESMDGKLVSDATQQKKSAKLPSTISPEVKASAAAAKFPQMAPSQQTQTGQSYIERFLGENLINKIGIVVIMLGVGIGARYAIDRQLISPEMRIGLGYLIGLFLVAASFRLKQAYHNFSAVLLSGGTAIGYFITYFAYAQYGFLPLIPAFGVMVALTVFTVFSALRYNLPVIANLGLVGAYAVPFMLSPGYDGFATLMAYIVVINLGILAVAVNRYWKSLYHAAFTLSWLIYTWCYLWIDWQRDEALLFGALLFVIFYGTFIAYKLLKRELFTIRDVAVVLLNSFLFFAAGYAYLSESSSLPNLTGPFAVGNALVHAAVAFLFYHRARADKNLFLFAAGLAVVLFTIAVPIQLDGSWVTLIWAGEAAVLFYVGNAALTTQASPGKFNFYHRLSLPLLGLALLRLFGDWGQVMESANSTSEFKSLLHVEFLVSTLVIAALGWMNYRLWRVLKGRPVEKIDPLRVAFTSMLPLALIAVVYGTFFIEINAYFQQLRLNQFTMDMIRSGNAVTMGSLWLLCYSLLFAVVLSMINGRYFKVKIAANALFVAQLVMVAFFLTFGLNMLGELRVDYLRNQANAPWMWIGMRYISLVFVAVNFWSLYKSNRSGLLSRDTTVVIDLVLHTTILATLTTELLQWLHFTGDADSSSIVITVLWGVYAFAMIGLGIYQKKQHVRMGALALFAVTLGKLFLFDLQAFETVVKTVVLIAIGLLLVLASFLYNKYKDLIWGKTTE